MRGWPGEVAVGALGSGLAWPGGCLIKRSAGYHLPLLRNILK